MSQCSLFGTALAIVLAMGNPSMSEAGGPVHHGGHHSGHHGGHGHAHGGYPGYYGSPHIHYAPRPIGYRPYVPAPVVVPAYPPAYAPAYGQGCVVPGYSGYSYGPSYGYQRPSGFGIRTDDFSLWLGR